MRSERGNYATPSPALNERVAAAAADAVELTDVYFVTDLDFSEATLRELDRVANDVHCLMPGGETPEDIDLLVRLWGRYVGEVFRRQLDAEWVVWEDEFGTTAAVRKGGHTIFPLDRVRKRLEQGAENSLWGYFGTFRALMD